MSDRAGPGRLDAGSAPLRRQVSARAEEALCGVPKGGNPSDCYGNLDKALALYQQLVKEAGDSAATSA